jgi:short subunit dehydrogenase-like uncharacterized protein
VSSLLIYGAYGFVGDLVAREAVSRGLDPILAGRDGEALGEQAIELGCRSRRFDLSTRTAIADELDDVDCVLNCAGPFSNTAETLVGGALRSGTDYVDITGEIPVIERIRGWDDIATDVGVTLLPSAGFSSVPMDCLAAHLASRAPDANYLALGVDSFRIPSVGSIKTAIEGIDTGGAVRRDGRVEYVPAAWRSRHVDFGRGTRPAVTMPLGEVSTAYYTTGIPDVDVYVALLPPARIVLAAHSYVAPLLATTPVQWALARLAEFVRTGPSERARARGWAYLWGEARADDGGVVSRLRTPDAYVVTPDAAVTVAERVLADDAEAGVQTPAGAFGPEFVFELDGVDGFYDERGVRVPIDQG